jgi:uncharacterized protein YggE
MDRGWDSSADSADRTVDTHVKTLRAKLRAAGASDDPIRTHRGLGYALEVQPMRLVLKLFLGFFLITGIAAFFVMRVFVNEVKPGVRQAMESTLVDAANVLAEMAAADVKDGTIRSGSFTRNLAKARQRDLKAMVWRFPKRSLDYR